MTSGRRPAALLALLAAIAGCGAESRGATEPSEHQAIIRTMRQARVALLGERGRATCSLLTRHARRRSLAFKVDFDHYGRIPSGSPRLPQTCPQVMRREWREVHRFDRDPATRGAISWPRDLRNSTFAVARVDGARALVKLSVRGKGELAKFRLRKTSAGWRIDDSDAVPAGH